MNNPASKEPSMDEILSSIRQIIADEDKPGEQGTAQAAEAAPPGPSAPQSEAEADKAMMEAQQAEPVSPSPLSGGEAAADGGEPLALSPDQMIAKGEQKREPEAERPSDDDDLGISFSPVSSGLEAKSPPSMDPSPRPVAEQDEVAEQEESRPEIVAEADPEPEEEIEMVIADDVTFDESAPEPETVASPEAMPDPELSSDMAEKLLEPATEAAVGHAFSRLNSLAMGDADLTLEGIVRDMLRPMLKEWLDENLPATVERMVEKEIERVSRGS